jgi:hypothetical protein
MGKKASTASAYPEASSIWKRNSTVPALVVEEIRQVNYTRSVRFRFLTELSRLQCDADGADTYDGVHQHQFGRVAVSKLYQRQAWRRRWEWTTYLEKYDGHN